MALFARIVTYKTNKHVPQSLFHKESLSKVFDHNHRFSLIIEKENNGNHVEEKQKELEVNFEMTYWSRLTD